MAINYLKANDDCLKRKTRLF